jgi:2-haloacid dehalogenase
MHPAPLPLTQDVTTLTFDCYGTLIDWETGILAAVRPVFGPAGVVPTDAELLEAYAIAEAGLESGPYQPYRTVLAGVMRELSSRFGVKIDDHQAGAIARSLPTWRAFPDTIAAMHRLRRRFRLGVISNVDDDLFAGTRDTNALPVDWVVTAEQCRSYKPSEKNFRVAMEAHGLTQRTVLHVAESLYHDVAPCRALGVRSVWVHRRAGRPGSGATHPASAVPDLRVTSLAELADALGV